MGQCISPFQVKQDDKYTPVPCGKCHECFARRISGWSFRLMQQDKDSLTAHFITLTYGTEQIPISQNGFLNLQKRDLQLFFKRLRKAHAVLYKKLQIPNSERRPIKYYAVGEYGTIRKRPHYHVIIFDCFIELVQEAWTDPKTKQPIGEIHYGTVSEASVGYTLKYMSKPSKIPLHQRDDRQKEFSLMSKNWVRRMSMNEQPVGIWQILRNVYISISKTVKKLPCPGTTKTKSMTMNPG